jgi:hypothetical protein
LNPPIPGVSNSAVPSYGSKSCPGTTEHLFRRLYATNGVNSAAKSEAAFVSRLIGKDHLTNAAGVKEMLNVTAGPVVISVQGAWYSQLQPAMPITATAIVTMTIKTMKTVTAVKAPDLLNDVSRLPLIAILHQSVPASITFNYRISATLHQFKHKPNSLRLYYLATTFNPRWLLTLPLQAMRSRRRM